VVVFSTGDELREPGQPLGPGLVRDSNSFTVAGMVRESGSEPTRGGMVADDADVLREKFQSFLPQADVFVTSGGIARGEDDHVRAAVAKLGQVDLWEVSVNPGGSLAFGAVEGRPFFGLPGNAVAVVIAFELFVRPALLKMAGRQTLNRPEVEGVLEDGFRRDGHGETYLRVRAWQNDGAWRARLAGKQGQNIVSSVAGANALAVIGNERASVSPGDSVRLLLLEPLEGW
jgi:molybdopterin molybdotransferase